MEDWVRNLQLGYPGSLANTLQLCENCGNPQNSFKTLHVAGTNGKGSVTKKCSAVLERSGYKVGMFISPHIFEFTERIQINHQAISNLLFYHYSEVIKNLSERLGLVIGWFDLYVLVCFLYFRDERVDWACVEVGLGGRLDNTNVIFPIVSVIVSIGLDHVEILGDTLEKITLEKAGIIKENTPCVYGPSVIESIVLEKCLEKAAQPIKVNLPEGYRSFDEENSAVAEMALRTLAKIGFIIEESAFSALESAQPFRMQEFYIGNNLFICDVAHNPAGITRVLNDLCYKFKGLENVIAVLGMSKGKMIKNCVEILAKRVKEIYFVSGHSEKLLPAHEISRFGQGESWEIPAILENLSRSKSEKIILITGSFYIMEEVSICISHLNSNPI